MMKMTGHTAVVPTTIAEAPFMYDAFARDLVLRTNSARGGLRVVEGGPAGRAAHDGVACSRRAGATTRRPLGGARELVLAALVVALCVCALLAWALAGHIALASATSDVTYEQVSVDEGESLWSISEAHPVDGLSTQQVVSLVSQRNDLSSSVLQPGQTLMVPAAD